MKSNSENSVLRKVTSLLLVGIVLLAGVGIDLAPNMIWHDQQRIGQIVLLVIVGLALATVWRGTFLISLIALPSWARQSLGGGVVLGGISVVLSAYPRFAGLEWSMFLLLLGLGLVLAGQARLGNRHFDVWAMRCLVAVAMVIALKIMMGYLAAVIVGVPLDTIALFEGVFSNRRVFGQVASMVIPLLAFPLLKAEVLDVQKRGIFVLLAVWWMLVVISGTRGTWVALLLASSVLGVCAWRAAWPWLKFQLVALASGALLFLVFFVWLPEFFGPDANIESRLSNISALNGRAELWGIAWAQIQAHSWLGIGPMHLAAIRNNFGAHPHNAVLQLAAEWGVPATLALILPVVVGGLNLLARLQQQREDSPNALLLCLTASLLAAGAQSLVDGVIVIPYTQTLLVLVSGWALGVYWRGAVAVLVAPDSNLVRVVILGFSGLALATLLYGVFPEVLNRAEMTQAYIDAGNVLVPPRYWALGWIP